MAVYGAHLGNKINALLFTGYATASLTGVLLANFVAPFFGWTAVFFTLALLTIVSLVLLYFFEETHLLYVPFNLTKKRQKKN
jgi:predicted MFS family arabinose efflux permease